MPITIVVGGQFGSEGKGKVAHYLSKEQNADIVVRVGGPNSGHTVAEPDGREIIFQHLPTAAVLPDPKLVLPAGSYINPEILLREIKDHQIDPYRVLIDPLATVVTERHREQERRSGLGEEIGSTLSGTGAAVYDRIARNSDCPLARHDPRLRPFIRNDLANFFDGALKAGKRIIIEGTQGFGLSLLHSPDYPHVTSRDTTAAGFLSEVGLSPLDVDEIVLVIRAFPIRVSGNSGRLPNECSWEEITTESRYPNPLEEFTSVTKRLRRVAKFDASIVSKAIQVNQPTKVVLNHLDYVDYGCREQNRISPKSQEFLANIEAAIERTIDLVGVSPSAFYPCSSYSVLRKGAA